VKMKHKNIDLFIENYDAFLRIKMLLYGFETYKLVETTDQYTKLIVGLLSYMKKMSKETKLYIDNEYPMYKGCRIMERELIGQLRILKIKEDKSKTERDEQ
jgi:hypothetical protein